MSQLGRISGPLLEANLNRLGVDLTFRNYSASDDLLYLDVNNNRIGVNKTPAQHRAEVDGTTRTTNLIATTSGDIATITLNGNTFSTDIVSTIIIRPNQTSPLVTMDLDEWLPLCASTGDRIRLIDQLCTSPSLPSSFF